jgi:hypothetical protein
MAITISTDRAIGVVIVLMISLFTWVWDADNRLIKQEIAIKACVEHHRQLEEMFNQLSKKKS